MAAAEARDRLVIGVGLPGEEHEADVRGESRLELARARDAGGVAIEEDLEHEPGVVRRHPPRLVVRGEEGGQVEVRRRRR